MSRRVSCGGHPVVLQPFMEVYGCVQEGFDREGRRVGCLETEKPPHHFTARNDELRVRFKLGPVLFYVFTSGTVTPSKSFKILAKKIGQTRKPWEKSKKKRDSTPFRSPTFVTKKSKVLHEPISLKKIGRL